MRDLDAFRRRLGVAMAARGLKQAALAAAIGIKPQNLSQILVGKRPGKHAVELMAGVLQVPIAWLDAGDGPHPDLPGAYFNEDTEIPDAKDPNDQAPAWAVELLREVQALRREVATLRPSLRDQPAVRDIRAALEPEEREHERTPTYPARSPDLTGAPRHGK